MTRRDKDPALSLVTSAYAVAVEPERFDDLLAAWDVWIDSGLGEAADEFSGIAPAFDAAIATAARLENADVLSEKSGLEAAPSAAILLDGSGRVLAVNQATEAVLNAEGVSAQALYDSAQRIASEAPATTHLTYRLGAGPGSRTFLAVETPVRHDVKVQFPEANRMLLISLIDWSVSFKDELKLQLNLSEAELRVAKGLLEGQTAQEISGALSRSLPTIRSHIKTLLKKTGARRQTELVQILTILRQLADLPRTPPPTGDVDAVRETSLSGKRRGLRVAEYGSGSPLLYFATSSCPGESEAVRAAMGAEDFAVFAPYRPDRETRRRASQSSSDALLDDWLSELHAYAGHDPLLVGHREGGVLALKAAEQLLDAREAVSGVVLISTGVPVASLAEFRVAGPSVYRSFLAAHTAPVALRLGYRTAARIFASGPAGQDRILKYFFSDSPVDAELVRDRTMNEIVRANLAYCFEDTPQVVVDIKDWTSDWSDLLIRVVEQVPVTFVHGTEHPFFEVASIAAYAEAYPNLQLRPVEGEAQMALYAAPQEVAAACRETTARNAVRGTD